MFCRGKSEANQFYAYTYLLVDRSNWCGVGLISSCNSKSCLDRIDDRARSLFLPAACRYRLVADTSTQIVAKGWPDLATQQFQRIDAVTVGTLREALAVAQDGADSAEEVAAGVRGKYKHELERGLIFLGTLGNNAPFIGLFGTVLGIINAFRDLSGAQLQAASTRIMGSISEALVATAVGLLVAIPAVIAFNVYQRQVKKMMTQSDLLLHELLSYLRRNQTPQSVQRAGQHIPPIGEHNG